MSSNRNKHHSEAIGDTQIIAARLTVPLSVRGLFAETLTDWLEAARQAGVTDLQLNERIDEINRAYATAAKPPAVLRDGLIENLNSELNHSALKVQRLAGRD